MPEQPAAAAVEAPTTPTADELAETARILQEQNLRLAEENQRLATERMVAPSRQQAPQSDPLKDAVDKMVLDPDKAVGNLDIAIQQRADYYARRAAEQTRAAMTNQIAEQQNVAALQRAYREIPDIQKPENEAKFQGVIQESFAEMRTQGLAVTPDLLVDRAMRKYRSRFSPNAPGNAPAYVEGASSPAASPVIPGQPAPGEPVKKEYSDAEVYYGLDLDPDWEAGSLVPVPRSPEEKGKATRAIVRAHNDYNKKRGLIPTRLRIG